MNLLRLLCLTLLLCASPGRAADRPVIEVWKSRSCGCCVDWVDHVREAGFEVRVTNLDDMTPIKQRFKVPPELSSCHTATVGGYVIEGHVPADDIIRLLKLQPAVTGIYVPGMPIGSPGMEGPRPEAYDVIAVDAQGGRTVFATHKP
jgi:hypothetical protein